MTLTFSVSPYVLFCLPMRDPRENLSSLERNDSSRVVGCRHVFGQRSFSPFWSHQMRWVSAPLGDTACLRSTFGVCGFLSLNHKSYFSVLAKTPGNQVLIKIQLNSAKTRSKHERLSCRNGWWGNEGRQGPEHRGRCQEVDGGQDSECSPPWSGPGLLYSSRWPQLFCFHALRGKG